MGRVRLLAAWLWAAELASCEACAPEAVAELRGRTGQVQRDYASSVERWSDAELGTRFRIGDGLRTSADSHAMLELAPSGTAYVAPSTVVRFSADAPGEPAQHIVLEAGSIELSSDRFEIVVHTPRALARLSRRARVKLSAGDERGGSISIALGSASLLRNGEDTPIAVQQGETHALVPWGTFPAQSAPLALTADVQAAAADTLAASTAPAADPLHAAAAAAPSEPATKPAAKPATTRAAKAAEARPEPAAPAPAPDVRVSLSEHAVIHADALPIRTELLLPSCDDGSGELSVDERRTPSDTQASLELGAGRHVWSFRCGGRVLGEGAMLVQRDDARAALPSTPADVQVATDGRHYRVRHTGTPPNLAVRWPGAPAKGPYTLRIKSGGRTRELRLSEPTTLLRGAELGSSNLELVFSQLAGGSAPNTTVELSVDGQADPLAWETSAASPRAGRVAVRGHVLPGSRLRLGGARVQTADDGQFAVQVNVPATARAVVAEVSHPLLGRHYYVRRLH
jgi:hypothetical protein